MSWGHIWCRKREDKTVVQGTSKCDLFGTVVQF